MTSRSFDGGANFVTIESATKKMPELCRFHLLLFCFPDSNAGLQHPSCPGWCFDIRSVYICQKLFCAELLRPDVVHVKGKIRLM